MFQFTYKLKLTERVKAKCIRHPRYNPEKDGRAGIRGGCSTALPAFRSTTSTRLALRSMLRSVSSSAEQGRGRNDENRVRRRVMTISHDKIGHLRLIRQNFRPRIEKANRLQILLYSHLKHSDLT